MLEKLYLLTIGNDAEEDVVVAIYKTKEEAKKRGKDIIEKYKWCKVYDIEEMEYDKKESCWQ